MIIVTMTIIINIIIKMINVTLIIMIMLIIMIIMIHLNVQADHSISSCTQQVGNGRTARALPAFSIDAFYKTFCILSDSKF